VEKVEVQEFVNTMERLHGLWTRQTLLVLAVILAVVCIILVLLQALGVAYLPTKALLTIVGVCVTVVTVVVRTVYQRSSDK
jgi:uncharacterized membrane protein